MKSKLVHPPRYITITQGEHSGWIVRVIREIESIPGRRSVEYTIGMTKHVVPMEWTDF